MKATIFHNPLCGTSRKTLEILRDEGCDVWIQEYLKTPPSRDELARSVSVCPLRPGKPIAVHLPVEAEKEGMAPTLRTAGEGADQ